MQALIHPLPDHLHRAGQLIFIHWPESNHVNSLGVSLMSSAGWLVCVSWSSRGPIRANVEKG